MKKYSKKLALILVLALVLATAIPALAATEFKTDITGTYEDIDLQVIVPSAGDAILNPYGLPVKIFGDDGSLIDSLKKPGQIATKPLVGANLTDVNLKVGATVTGKVVGGFKFATSAPSKTAKTKTGLVYLQVKAVSNLGYSMSPDAVTVCDSFDGAKVVAALNAWTLPTKYNSKDADKLIVSATKANTKSGMCTIKAGEDKNNDGEIDTVADGGYFLARLTGSIVQKPSITAADGTKMEGWDEGDGFTAAITWEFEPAT